jgi:hypothetical protein
LYGSSPAVADQVTSKPVSHWFAWPETDQENCEAVWFLDAVLRHAVLWEPATCWISDTPPALESASRFSSGMGLLAGTDTEGIRHGYDVICSGIKLELDLPSVSHAYNGLASAHIVRSRAVQVGRFGYIVKERLVAHGPDRAHSEFRIDAYLCEVQVQRLTRSRPRTAASRCSTSMSRPVTSHRRAGKIDDAAIASYLPRIGRWCAAIESRSVPRSGSGREWSAGRPAPLPPWAREVWYPSFAPKKAGGCCR